MQTLVIDSSDIVKTLEQQGFSRMQAEGITEALKKIDTSTLATKADLKIALAEQTITMIKWITGMLLAQAAFIIAFIQYFK